MSFSNVGLVWTPDSLKTYLADKKPLPGIKAICLHHTASPSLANRPKGFTIQHIHNIKEFYQEKGWDRGPHFFTDEDQIFGMTPPTEAGIHAVSFNRMALGIEVLGDYDTENHNVGRGYECWRTTAACTKVLLDWLGLPVNAKTVLFHREDPKTSKTCPGTKVLKNWVLGMINNPTSAPVSTLPTITTIPPEQLVGVIDYIVANKGYTEVEATALLHRDGALFIFGNDWLEGARYDAVQGKTVAPIKELCLVKAKGKVK